MCHYTEWMQKRFLASTAWWSFILLDHIQYWAWQILLYSDALWNYSSGWCFPVQAWWMFWQDGTSYHNCWWYNDYRLQVWLYWPWASLHNPGADWKEGNVRLNYDKLQYKQNEVEFYVKPIQQVVASQAKIKLSCSYYIYGITTNKKQVQSFICKI